MRALAALLFLAPAAALAHATSISYSELSLEGQTVRGELRFSLPDLQTQGPVDPARLDPALLRPLVLDPFVLSQEGKPCALSPGTTARMDGPDGVTVQAAWTCPAPIRKLSVRVGFLDSFPLGHTHLSRVLVAPGQAVQRVAQQDAPSFEVEASASAALSGGLRFFLLGAEHVALGPEHLAFLLLLAALAGRRLGEEVRVVASFTLWHAIALLLSTLAALAVPAKPLDLLLALGVAAAGAENLWALRRERMPPALERRWLLASALGALHGLAFEGALPRASVAAGMLPFTAGLLAAQLVLVGGAWLGGAWLARQARLVSLLGSAIALVWLVARLR